MLPGVVQRSKRDPLGNRPTLHLATAIMVALGEGALHAPHPSSLRQHGL